MSEEQDQLSPVEEQARAQGHVSKEEWVEQGRDPEDWKDARTFVREGEMMERIGKMNRAIDRYKSDVENLKQTMNRTSTHFAKMLKIEKDRTVKELKAQKAQAIRDEDAEGVVEIDDQIKQVEQEYDVDVSQDNAKATQEQNRVLIDEWLDDPENEWYHEDFQLHNAADRHFAKLAKESGMTVERALKETEEHIKKKFPKKFGKTETEDDGGDDKSRKKTSKVLPASGKERSGGRSSGRKYTKRDLNQEELEIANTVVGMGAFKNVQEYVDSLSESGYFTERDA